MRRKLLGIFIAILFLGIVTTGYISYSFSKNIVLNNIKENLKNECILVEDNFINYNGDYDVFARKIKSYINKRATIIQESGKVLG